MSSPGRRPPGAGKAPRSHRAPGLGPLTDRQRGELPADATVTLAEERQAAGIDDVLAALDRELVGLAVVKQHILEIAALLLVDRARAPYEQAFLREFLKLGHHSVLVHRARQS